MLTCNHKLAGACDDCIAATPPVSISGVVLLQKEYGWEDLSDLGRDVVEAVEDSGLPGEFKGVIELTIRHRSIYDAE